MRKLASVAVLVVAVCVGSPAFACKGKDVLFQDNFSDDSNWGDVSEYGSIADGVWKLTAKKGYSYHFFYQGDSYDKVDLCVDLAQLTEGDAGAGLVFAAQGNDSYYYLWANPNGVAGVSRKAKNKWLNPVPARKVNVNAKRMTLRVTLDGNRGTAYVNDQKIADFRVVPVEGGGFIGIAADGGPDGDITWGFSNLKATDLP